MSTLLMRLSGPMQSWGTDSRFDLRFTSREPSKSGVLGLVCAALGKPRGERPGDGFPSLAELAGLRMGVRVDRPGSVRVDYQTAGAFRKSEERQRYGIVNAKGELLKHPVTSYRYYLADAAFLVALEGDETLLRRIDAALAAPVWQLYLGRKSYVPSEPVRLLDAGPDSPWWRMPVEEALAGAECYPWLGRDGEPPPPRLRVVLEAEPGPDAELRPDVPLDFAARRFGMRAVRTVWTQPRLQSAATGVTGVG
jgi:CRISPR system Cascade subunit CasD